MLFYFSASYGRIMLGDRSGAEFATLEEAKAHAVAAELGRKIRHSATVCVISGEDARQVARADREELEPTTAELSDGASQRRDGGAPIRDLRGPNRRASVTNFV
jgi:hypothetical protein